MNEKTLEYAREQLKQLRQPVLIEREHDERNPVYLVDGSLIFDDFVTNEDGSCWAYICKECVEKYGISKSHLDHGCGGSTCGVQGCENEADFYIDIPKTVEGPAENESIWRVALEIMRCKS